MDSEALLVPPTKAAQPAKLSIKTEIPDVAGRLFFVFNIPIKIWLCFFKNILADSQNSLTVSILRLFWTVARIVARFAFYAIMATNF